MSYTPHFSTVSDAMRDADAVCVGDANVRDDDRDGVGACAADRVGDAPMATVGAIAIRNVSDVRRDIFGCEVATKS